MPIILVVAEQPDIRQKLYQIYLQGGYVTLEAHDSLTAFAQAREQSPDLVLISLAPNTASLEICSRFANDYKLPVLYYTSDDNIDTALDAGASAVVTDFHPRLLLHCAQVLLEAHASVAQSQLAKALRDTADVLNSTLEIDAVLDRILTLIQDVIPSDLSTMYLIDESGEQARTSRTVSVAHPELINALNKVVLPLNEIQHLREMVETKAPMLITDTSAIPSWVPFRGTEWIRSVLSATLQIEGKVIGFIFLNAALPHAFTTVDSETLQIFANQASIAISNARRYAARSQDATEMKKQVAIRTAELEQKSSQLEAILETIGEGVQGILFDENIQNRSYSFINRALHDLFGYENNEMTSFDLLRPDDVSAESFETTTSHIYDSVLENGLWQGERRLKRKNGTVVDTGLVVSGLKTAEGRLTGIVSIFRDLSKQKALDAQKERFVGDAAHELRNPIAALKLRLHLLALQPERLEANVSILDRITTQMENLVEDMLDLTRFENGLIRLKDAVTEITSFVRETILIMESEAEVKNVWLIDRLPTEPVYVSIDQTRMMQVIMNLVSNAVKYTPEDHAVTILVKRGKEGTEHAGYMVMKIIDTGDGIPAEFLPNIFEPFYQVRTGGRGLGLGLAIIKQIVELHDGRISVESEIGKGTTFTVLLKLVDPPA